MPKSARLIPVAGPIAGHAEIVISGNRAVRIGRSQEAEFPIPVDPQISTIHVSLTTNEEGLVVIDQNSTNGTFVNGRRIEKKVAFDGDEVRLGQSIWRVAIEKALRRSSHTDFSPQSAYPKMAVAEASENWSASREQEPYRSAPAQFDQYSAPRFNHAATGPQLELNSGDQKLIFHPNDRLTIGRTTAADIQFADLMMSSCHFLVYFEQGRWNIADCNSTNGLFCNGDRISKTDLNSGDIVKAGQTTFDVKVRRPEGVPPPPIQTPSFPNGLAHAPQVPADPKSEPQRRVIKSDADQIPDAPLASSFESDQAIRRSIHRSRKKSDELGIPANATLKQLTGNQYSFALFNERNVIIGSSPQADIVIPEDDAVAEKHLNLMLTTGMLVVEDLQSRSGTYVDGERVTRALVQDGSVLQIGNCKMLFTLIADEAAIVLQPPSRIPAENKPATPDTLHKELDFEYDDHLDHTEIGELSAPPVVVEELGELEAQTDQTPEAPLPSADPEIEPASDPDLQPGETSEPEVEPGAEPDSSPVEPLQPEVQPGTQSPPQLPPDLEPDVPPEWQPDPSPTPEIEPDESPEIAPESEPELQPELPVEIEPQPELSSISPVSSQASIPFVQSVANQDTFVPPPAIFQSTIVSDVYASESGGATIEQTLSADVPLEVISSVPPISVTDVQETAPTESGHALLLKGYISIDTSAIEARKLKFDNAIHYASTMLPSGLQLYQGCKAGDDPIEICRRLLHAMPGYLIDVEPIEFWHKMGQATQEPEDWLMLASPDDASWMIPVMTKWSKDTIFLGFSRKNSENVRQTLLSVSKDKTREQLASLNPSRLVDFLSTAPTEEVIRFFADFDAIFLEVKSSDLWALFARPDFGNILKHLQLHQKDET